MENAKQLRPVGRLLIDSWKTYQVNCKKISLLMLWGLIGFVPYGLMITLSLSFGWQVGVFQIPLALITFLFYLALLYWIISTFLGLVILLKNPKQGIIEVFNAGRKLVWGYLAVGLILFMFVSLWSILFIIPGVIYYVFYAVTMFVFVYEGYRRSTALARSKELVSGNWWPVFGRLVLVILIAGIYGYIFGMILAAGRAVGLLALIMPIYLLSTFLLIAPLSIVYFSLIYNDLNAIKPTSSLPKERNDYWLVAVAAVFLIITVLIILSLILLAIALTAQSAAAGL